MNLKLKRSTRTPYSEEISIYDQETRDENEEPVSIGKIDVHYLDDQVVGTLLIWQEFATGYRQAHGPGSPETLDDLIDAILAEVSEPVGISATYAVEVYYPPYAGQGFVSNYPDEENNDAGVPADDSADMGMTEEAPYEGEEQPEEDDFADKLRQRP
jgi:hypothetical protein